VYLKFRITIYTVLELLCARILVEGLDFIPMVSVQTRALHMQLLRPIIERKTNLMKTFEIVGLRASGNGRNCAMHEVCGSSITVGDTVVLEAAEVVVRRKKENAVAVRRLKDGRKSCRVGFIPKISLSTAVAGTVMKITALCDQSISREERSRSRKHAGMAKAIQVSATN
jgi:hypothetical protein